MTKIQFQLMMVYFVAASVAAIPLASAKEDGGVDPTGATAAPTIPVGPAPTALPIAAPAPTASPAAPFKPTEEMCLEAYPELCKKPEPEATKVAETPKKPAKSRRQLNKEFGEAFVSCEPPMIKRFNDDGTAYCVPERGLAVRSIEESAPAPGKQVHGLNAASQADLERLEAKVAIICGGPDEEQCRAMRAEFEALRDWRLDLTTPRRAEGDEREPAPPLVWDSWQAVWDRLDQQADGLIEVINVLCPVIPERPQATIRERCEHAQAKVCKKDEPGCSELSFEVALRAGWMARRDSDSPTLTVDPTLFYWPNAGNNGVYLGGIGGVAFPSEGTKAKLGARLGYTRKLEGSQDTFRIGGVAMSEPEVEGLNDSLAVGAEIGVDFCDDDQESPLCIGLGIAAGAEKHAVRGTMPDGTEVRVLSSWGGFVYPNIDLALRF